MRTSAQPWGKLNIRAIPAVTIGLKFQIYESKSNNGTQNPLTQNDTAEKDSKPVTK